MATQSQARDWEGKESSRFSIISVHASSDAAALPGAESYWVSATDRKAQISELGSSVPLWSLLLTGSIPSWPGLHGQFSSSGLTRPRFIWRVQPAQPLLSLPTPFSESMLRFPATLANAFSKNGLSQTRILIIPAEADGPGPPAPSLLFFSKDIFLLTKLPWFCPGIPWYLCEWSSP